MKIILSGYMGSGKSEVGRLLAASLNLDFIDLDQKIEQQESSSVSTIFETKGEIYFRKRETEILQQLLKEDLDFVLALGGGTPCYGKNIQIIRATPGTSFIYLKASLQELTKRLFPEKAKRPLIAHLENQDLLEDFIRKHLFERTFYYSQSDLTIDTDNKTPEEIRNQIKLKLN